MTPSVIDVASAPAGGPTHLDSHELGRTPAHDSRGSLRTQYRAVPRGRIYRVVVSPARLTAIIEATEDGFAATCPELESLGYGRLPQEALTDLIDATRDYLTMLAEDRPPLAPRIASHALYVPLLGVPDASWFAAVTVLGDPGQDAP
jgi:hypothetical protein